MADHPPPSWLARLNAAPWPDWAAARRKDPLMATKPVHKSIPIPLKPSAAPAADAWVQDGTAPAAPPERTVRLSVDLPRSLHRQLKTYAVARDTTIQELVTTWLREHLAGNA